jgi:hypothetical protein
MPALTKARGLIRRSGTDCDLPVAANTVIWAGAMVARNATGLAVPASANNTLLVMGVTEQTANNLGGSASAMQVKYTRKAAFNFFNHPTDLVTPADIGNNCFVVDDQTVAKTSATNTRPIAGRILDVDASFVWVEF